MPAIRWIQRSTICRLGVSPSGKAMCGEVAKASKCMLQQSIKFGNCARVGKCRASKECSLAYRFHGCSHPIKPLRGKYHELTFELYTSVLERRRLRYQPKRWEISPRRDLQQGR